MGLSRLHTHTLAPITRASHVQDGLLYDLTLTPPTARHAHPPPGPRATPAGGLQGARKLAPRRRAPLRLHGPGVRQRHRAAPPVRQGQAQEVRRSLLMSSSRGHTMCFDHPHSQQPRRWFAVTCVATRRHGPISSRRFNVVLTMESLNFSSILLKDAFGWAAGLGARSPGAVSWLRA